MNSIGRYEVRHLIGIGGMAEVYLAHDPDGDQLVAIKLLLSQFTSSPSLRLRMEREAALLDRLGSAPIVPILATGDFEGRPFLVMRHMSGGTLREKINARPMALDEILLILERLGQALDAAHQRGIVHRDLKPANVLFDDQGQAYLSDFGIAKVVQVLQETRQHSLTGIGVIGTPDYMSPEQASASAEIDYRTDIYSLGIMLYEMLTGAVPYRGDAAVGIMMQHVTAPIPRLTRRGGLRLGRLSAWNRILARALAKKPQQRYSGAGELVADVRRLVESAATAERHAAQHTTQAAPTPTLAEPAAPFVLPQTKHAPMPSWKRLKLAARWEQLAIVLALPLFVVLAAALRPFLAGLASADATLTPAATTLATTTTSATMPAATTPAATDVLERLLTATRPAGSSAPSATHQPTESVTAITPSTPSPTTPSPTRTRSTPNSALSPTPLTPSTSTPTGGVPPSGTPSAIAASDTPQPSATNTPRPPTATLTPTDIPSITPSPTVIVEFSRLREDVNEDCYVTQADIDLVMGYWTTSVSPVPPECPRCDVDGNGWIDINDVTSIIIVWTEDVVPACTPMPQGS